MVVRTRVKKATKTQNAETSLLNAAEALFADREFDSVSTRDIASKAKVNLALVHYYFGTKQKLFRAVLARRIEELSRRRLDLLEQRRRFVDPIPIAQIAEAFVLPLLELATTGDRGWRNYIRLNGRVASSDKYMNLAGSLYDPAATAFINEIARSLPNANGRDIQWGYLFMVSAMSCAFAGGRRIERLSGGHSSDLGEAYSVLIPFVSEGLVAAVRASHPAPSSDRLRLVD
ncbi:MAG: TetR family transcriptional regulator [Pseudorhodoplanes sp.]